MSYRLTKIYTRTGDDGKTNLGTKDRFSKNSPRIEALGTLDELNCALGVVLAQPGIPGDMHKLFTLIQHDLFNLGAELCPPYQPIVTDDKIQELEVQIDKWNEELEPLTEFVLPRGDLATAHCHMARAICRRAERRIVPLLDEDNFRITVLKYINRLSDWLFVAARILGKSHKQQEVLWDHEKR